MNRLSTKPRKPKRCKGCREYFTPTKPLQVACDIPCAIKHAEEKRLKKFRAETTRRKKELRDKDPKHWAKRAKTACHRYIKLRDRLFPCISCGTKQTAQWDAGHYRPSHMNAAVRYHELNIHKQCCTCNDGNKLSGNPINYRIGLVKKIGVEAVEWLEQQNHTKRWTIDELKEVEAYYLAKIKELEV